GAGTVIVNNNINISTGGVTKTDSGTAIFNVASNYSGTTTVNGGILRINDGGALGSTSGGTTVNANGTLELGTPGASNALTVAEGLSLNSMGVNNIGGLHSIGNNTYSGKITLTGNSRINSDSGTLTLSNAAGLTSTTNSSFNITFGGSGDI